MNITTESPSKDNLLPSEFEISESRESVKVSVTSHAHTPLDVAASRRERSGPSHTTKMLTSKKLYFSNRMLFYILAVTGQKASNFARN